LLDALPSSEVCGDTDESVYKSTRGIPELISWYTREMERFGWRLLANSVGVQTRASQTLCVFEKPNSICVVTLRQAGSRTVIYTNVMSRRVAAN
jgi:hypothetical protein